MSQPLTIEEIRAQGREPTRAEILALLGAGADLPTAEELKDAADSADQFIAQHGGSQSPTPLEMRTTRATI